MIAEFPKDFVWGVATASYQIEGAHDQDGKGESIWDRFAHTKGKIFQNHNGDNACDHYHLYKQDIKLLAEIGVDSYRFSLSWPRIFPAGNGPLNRKGLDFYERLLDELEERGISPSVTLYHWDLPQALQEKGGWENRDTAKYFRDYALLIFERFGNRVPYWITHNEPWCAAFLGYGIGHHAPGERDTKKAIQAGHVLLYSHGLAVDAYRQLGLDGKIGITLNLSPQYPISEKPEDIAAAHKIDGFMNRWYLDPIFKGQYPADTWLLGDEQGINPTVFDGDLALISKPIDFLGINYYTRSIVGASADQGMGVKNYPPTGPVTEMGWEVYPQGLYDLLKRVKEDYGDIPLYITENGAAYQDEIEKGAIHDERRRSYLENHFEQALQAIRDGVNLRGYYVWSFMDNFEWAFGYSRRFGLVYVDFKTQQRILKDSGKWFQNFLARTR